MTGFITLHAPTREELTSCVQCGLCLPACPTFRLTGDEAASPRGRLAAMAAVADGVAVVDKTFEELMGFCLQCRACEPACPSLVPYGRAMEGARAEIAAQRPKRRRRLRHRWLGSRGLGNRRFVRRVTRMASAGRRLGAHHWMPGRLRSSLRGMRKLPFRRRSVLGGEWPAIGEERGTAALLAGCVMDGWFGGVHTATIAALRHAGYRVVVPEGQTCCGALAAHDGAADEAHTMAEVNAAVFADVDLVIANAAGCSAHLKDIAPPPVEEGGEETPLPPPALRSGGGTASSARPGPCTQPPPQDGAPTPSWPLPPQAGGLSTPPQPRVADVVEIVAEAIADGRLPSVESSGTRVAVQDPCHLRHAQRITEEPRAMLRAAGYEVVEIDPDGMCCGAAGIYSVLRPDTSAELGRRKADQVGSAEANIVASANPGCEMQLRAHLDKGYRVAHPVELYVEAAGLL